MKKKPMKRYADSCSTFLPGRTSSKNSLHELPATWRTSIGMAAHSSESQCRLWKKRLVEGLRERKKFANLLSCLAGPPLAAREFEESYRMFREKLKNHWTANLE